MSSKAELINKQLGKNIRTMRLLQGLSQEVLGARVEPAISAQQMVKYERGIDRIRGDQLTQIMVALRCSPHQMFKGVSDYLPSEETNNISVKEGQIITAYRQIDDEELRSMLADMVKVCAAFCGSAFTASKPN